MNSVESFLQEKAWSPEVSEETRYSALLLLSAVDQERLEKLKKFDYATIRRELAKRRIVGQPNQH